MRRNDPPGYAKEILGQNPDVVLFSATSNQWANICRLALEIRNCSETVPLIVGGAHLTALPKAALNTPFDIAITGEGEMIIGQTVDNLVNHYGKPRKASNCRAVEGPIVDDIDRLPLPYIEMFETSDILAYPSVMFSRGCPYGCNYCMSRKGGVGGRIRWKSPARAINEIKRLVSCANPRSLFIDDDTLLKSPRWVRSFVELYTEEINLPFYCNARPETLSISAANLLKEAGCAAIGIGIESGSSLIRSRVLGRPMSNKTIINAFEIAHNAGLKTWSFNMVGIPKESLGDLQKTIALNKLIETEYIRVSLFTPYPGTPLGNINKNDYPSFFRSADTLPKELREDYLIWVQDLKNQGKFWLTADEEKLT